MRAGRSLTISIGRVTVAERRSRSLVTTLASVTAVATMLVGCSDAVDPAAGPAAGEANDAASPPAADPNATPATTSGDLSQDDLPAPEALGRDWQYRVDMGNAEDGYVGSGEPAIAREPQSVIAALTPLGCRPVSLPTPNRALEVTYQRKATPGVGLILQFADEATASEFFDGHAAGLRQCVDAPRINVEIVRDAAGVFVTTRTEELGETPSWVEAMAISDDEVTLIAVADPTARGIRTVTAAIT